MKDSSGKPYGYIYRIFHEKMLNRDNDGAIYQPCYIGRTEESIHKRFLAHKRDARFVRGNSEGGDGKLHAKMWAENCIGFKIEQLAVAYSSIELSELEASYIKKFDSITKGWNKITAASSKRPKGEKVEVVFEGTTRSFESLAHLCRFFDVSNTSLNHWIKKGLSLDDALKEAIAGKDRQAKRDSVVIEVFKRPYDSINAVSRDKKINKHGLSAQTLRKRVGAGMTIEDALLKPKDRPNERVTVKLPGGGEKIYKNIQTAHRDLVAQGLKVAPYSTVVSYVSKGQSIEQALGFESRPWELKYEEFDKLVQSEDYQYIGEKSEFSDPIVVHHEKKIYTSIKLFARTYGLDYSNITKKIKQGISIEEILKKSGHLR